jgi:hypothetical protein
MRRSRAGAEDRSVAGSTQSTVSSRPMSLRLALIAAVFWPTQAVSIGFPSFSSDIPGVQLWALSTTESGFPEEYFEDEGNEFIRYCDGSRSIYVGSSASPIRCKSEPTGSGTHRIFLNIKGRSFSGLVVVSKKPLPRRFVPHPLSADDIERLRKVEVVLKAASAVEAERSYMESFSGTGVPNYTKMLREITMGALYRKHGNARYKIPGQNGTMYITAVGAYPGGLGWDMKNVVLRQVEDRLEKIGEFWGCIEGFRDLDGDGAPEVLTRLCENNEGTDDRYWSLTPTARPVVGRSQ